MKTWLIAISLFCLGSMFSQHNKGTFEIHGEIEGEKKGKVLLKFQGFNQYLKTKLEDGKFVIKGELKRPTRVMLTHKNTNSIPFFIENSVINVTFYKDNLVNIHDSLKLLKEPHKYSKKFEYDIRSIEGSLSEDLYRDYIQFKKDNIHKPVYKHLLFNYLTEKLDKYPDNYVYVGIINQLCRRQEHLTYAQLVHLLNKLDLSQLDQAMRSSLLRNIEKLKHFTPGKTFPEKYASDLGGNTKLISEAYGKYTLIDLWASWCKPCRVKNPKIKVLYSKYKSKGFNVVGISIDRDADNWKLAIKQDDLPWTNYHSPRAHRDLLVPSIPYTFLIDENAKIVGINLTEQEIEAILQKNL